MAAHDPKRETYKDTRDETAEFRALLRKYHGDFQQAVDAQRRGETVPLDGEADTNSPF
jgi:hypothetical protein